MRNLPNPSVGNSTTAIKGLAGQNQQHESAHKHVSGEAVYIDDQLLPVDGLHAYVGLSTVSCGVIKNLDLSAVQAAEGVIDILTLDDVCGQKDIGPVFPGDPIMINDGDEVQFCGQILFAVAATSYKLARKAAALAIVEYQKKEPVVTIEQGLNQKCFVRPSHTQKRGNPIDAIKHASMCLKGDLRMGGQEHMYLEGQASICVPTEDGGMLVYSSTQNPTEGQKLVAEVLAIPMSKVTVNTRRMGGGFGGKETNANQWACLAALLANKTGKPVKIRLARSDDIKTTGKRHHFLSQYEVGFNLHGRILGLKMELAGGCGNSPDLSDAIVDRAMFHSDNAYYVPEVEVVGHRVKTNTVSNTAFRGFGGPQGVLAIEHIIDQIARAVGKDPLDVRKENFYTDKEGRNTTHYGQKIEQHIIANLVKRLEKTSDYRQRRKDINTFNQSSAVLKKGLALSPVKFGISFTVQHLNQAGALINIYTDGSIHLNHGGTEMGQGLFTKVAQVVASEFQVNVGRVLSSATRTDKVPNTSPTAASSGTDLNGMAAKDAAVKIKQRMIDFACNHFSITADKVQFHSETVIAGDQQFSFAEFVQLAYMNRVSLSATGFYKTPKIHYDREKARGNLSSISPMVPLFLKF